MIDFHAAHTPQQTLKRRRTLSPVLSGRLTIRHGSLATVGINLSRPLRGYPGDKLMSEALSAKAISGGLVHDLPANLKEALTSDVSNGGVPASEKENGDPVVGLAVRIVNRKVALRTARSPQGLEGTLGLP